MSSHRIASLALASSFAVATAQQSAPAPAPPAVPVPANAPEPGPAMTAPATITPAAPTPEQAVPRPVIPARLTPPATTQPTTAAPASPAPPPGVPVPGAAPVIPAQAQPQNQAAKPEVPLSETLITEPIEELKLSGDALAGLYRRYTGRRVIVPTSAAQAEFRFVQDASPKDPLTYGQAAELLKKAAILENFVFVPHPNDPTIDVLTLSTGGIRPPGIGIAIYNEGDSLPEGDEVISYVMKLDYIKPAEAVNIFTSIIGQFGAYGSVAPVANASAVVITENTGLIRKLIDLKKEIDKAGSIQTSRFIPVQFADVSEIATVLTELLTAQQQAQKTAGVIRTDAAPTPPNAPPNPGALPNAAAAGGGGGEETPPQIVPDPRTNRIFVMGRAADLDFIEGLVKKFDVPTSDKTFLRRKIRFLTVSEFLPIAGDALTRAFSGTGEGGASGSQTAGQSQQPRQQNSNRSQSNASSSSSTSRTNRSTGFNNNGMGGQSGGNSLSSGGLDDPSVNTAPESLLVGRTLLVADNITNSIIVQGPPSALEIVDKLIEQLDVKPEQVMISCVFGQLSLTDSKDLGMSYYFNSDKFKFSGGAGFPTTTTTSGSTTNTILGPGASSFTPAGLNIYGITGDLSMFLKATQDDSRFKVLSSPSIFATNNQKGSLISGTSIAVPTGSYSYGTSSSMSTNYEYKEVALKLDVIPLVNSNNEITLKIFLTSDDVGAERTVGTGDNAYKIPDILKRELTTTITVPNTQTVVLGGLITESDNTSKSGIPILCDIPGIGPLFGSNSKAKDRSELVIFIRPTLVSDNGSLNRVQGDMDRRYNTAGSARNFIDAPGLPTSDQPPIIESSGKGGSNQAPSAAPAAPRKSFIRPLHRR